MGDRLGPTTEAATDAAGPAGRPLVSVVVTTRNSARTLEPCLASIRKQTYPRLELLVIDNDSSDRTPAIARDYADTVATVGPERSAQRNHGASLSHGDLLFFVDSDMVLDDDVVAQAVALMDDPNVPAVVVPEVSFGDGFWTRCRILERSCYAGDDTVEAARVYRRASFNAAGGFDLILNGPEDWDLSRRIAGGFRLPRTSSMIHHDEGRTSLKGAFAKRRYYGTGYLLYLQKHGRGVLVQGNSIFRVAYARNWRSLVRHPVLVAGMLTLKSVELAAVLQVALERSLFGRSPTKPGHLYR